LAGFVLVSRYNYLSPEKDNWIIAEFLIMRKYRRHGIGTRVATRIFDMFPGKWQVAQVAANQPAQAFWRKVINRYTMGYYTEVFLNNDIWQGPVFSFDNTAQD
jgi:predicted acetyltransferase